MTQPCATPPCVDVEKLERWKSQYTHRNFLFPEEWEALIDLALKALRSETERPLLTGYEPTAPDTPGTWEERCAALYQVIGCLSHSAGIFQSSQDVTDALDVACGRGDVGNLLPWPKDVKLLKDLEARVSAIESTRDEIIEECAKMCDYKEDVYGGEEGAGAEGCARALRAMKGKS